MKTVLTLIIALSAVQSLSAYQPFNAQSYFEERTEKFNRDMDRTQNRMYQDEMIRLQREANQLNSSLGTERKYFYGR